jgi:hypothetical protein
LPPTVEPGVFAPSTRVVGGVDANALNQINQGVSSEVLS